VVTCPTCGEENPARFRLCGFCGTPLAAPLAGHEVRKTVTIVFSDLKGSTDLGEALDPESLRAVLDRYFEAMRTELERHGGTIEKYIGDAVMAVFGLPVVHEDDALRAVRAAHGMTRALARLNADLQVAFGVQLTNRTGVNTGEVVAGDPSMGQRLVTGDPVNTAARLEQAAPANEVLIGELTYRLVRDAVSVEALEPLELKGKAERVPAYRLLDVQGDQGWVRRQDTALVGRATEMRLLRARFDAAIQARAVRMVTVVAEAGVGKSRLVGEFTAGVELEADVARGRCLPYGEGITFWPLVEIVRAAAGLHEEDSPDLGRSKLRSLVDDPLVAARLASVVGLDRATFPVAEIFWAARRLLERLAERRPLVVVVDDIHWAEPTFLDLLIHVVETVSDAPVLVLCTARYELLEARPDWGEAPGTSRLQLGPLDEAESARLVESLLGRAGFPAEVADRIVGAAEGNPLFVEQMLAMLLESHTLRFDDGAWVRADETTEVPIPPTIEALLAARLDALGLEERAVIEPASVIGLVFARPAVTELAPEPVRSAVPLHLETLTRRRLVRPDPGAAGGDDDYRFGHLLIRDAAYAAMLKRARADLHERFVAWADRVNADRDRAAEFEEILGYHLEQAHRYLSELGPLDDHGRRVGADAARRLASAGRRAYLRGDMHAAANLFRRAAALQDPHAPERSALLPYLAESLWELGELDEADSVLDEAVRLADETRDEVRAADARIVRLFVDNLRGGEGWSRRVLEETAEAIPSFEAAGDHAALARAYRLLTWVHGTQCQYGAAVDAADLALEQARLAGDFRKEMGGASSYALAAYYGPTPVPEAIQRCERLVEQVHGDRGTEALVRSALAQLLAMDGRFDRAHEEMAAARHGLLDLGRTVLAASLSSDAWRIDLLAGDPAAAEAGLRRDIATLEAIGERYFLSTLAAGLAHVLYAQARDTEADAACRTAEELTAEDDVLSQVLWRSARAKIDGRAGRFDAALTSAASAVGRVLQTDGTIALADALADEAEVLAMSGRDVDAVERLSEALRLYRLKGDRVTSAAIDARLASGAPFSRPASRAGVVDRPGQRPRSSRR
jgi:class 3 adenylate cyclase/tetratricopeptide (TPR) repeat protein